jgi:hypothetical protein
MEERRDREIKLRDIKKKEGMRHKINGCPFSSYLD